MANNKTIWHETWMKIFAWTMVVVLACVIFWFSAQPATDSTEISNGVIKVIYSIYTKLFGQSPNAESKQLEQMIEIFTFPVRKGAHISEYVLFFCTVFFAFFTCGIKKYRRIAFSFFVTFFYACTDEFHQTFVPGRSGQFIDVLIDMIGVSILVCILLLKIKRTHIQ